MTMKVRDDIDEIETEKRVREGGQWRKIWIGHDWFKVLHSFLDR